MFGKFRFIYLGIILYNIVSFYISGNYIILRLVLYIFVFYITGNYNILRFVSYIFVLLYIFLF